MGSTISDGVHPEFGSLVGWVAFFSNPTFHDARWVAMEPQPNLTSLACIMMATAKHPSPMITHDRRPERDGVWIPSLMFCGCWHILTHESPADGATCPVRLGGIPMNIKLSFYLLVLLFPLVSSAQPTNELNLVEQAIKNYMR